MDTLHVVAGLPFSPYLGVSLGKCCDIRCVVFAHPGVWHRMTAHPFDARRAIPGPQN